MSQKNLRLSTDYPPDVVKLITGSQVIPSGGEYWGYFRIDTGLAVWAYPLMTFSFNADFSDQFFVGYGDYNPIDTGTGAAAPNNDSMSVTSRASYNDVISPASYPNLQVFAQWAIGTTAPTRTLYWRLALLPLTDWGTLAPNANQNTQFVFSTDNNYLKVFDKKVDLAHFGAPYTISTGLGYTPLCLPALVMAYSGVIDSVEPLYTGTFDPQYSIAMNIVRGQSNGDIIFSQMGAQIVTDSAVRIYVDEP